MLVGFWWLLLVLLWPQLCPRLCPCAVAAARRDRKGQKELPELPDTSLGNSEERPQLPEPAEPRITDPRRTWISFVHRPDDGSGSKRRCKGRDKKLRGLVGPPGPPGPQGPPGAPGAEVTKEILLQEFKEILKETIEHRASLALPAQPSPLPLLPLALAEAGSQRRLLEAFHCKLKGHVLVDKKTLVELQNFQLPVARGAFLRGSGLNVATGRFTAPVGGIYQFSANVHLEHSELRGRAALRARDSVRVLVCIESLCHRHASLEVIAGLESNSKTFTICVQGLLQLQAGQYASVFVDNGAGAAVTIQSGSDFMGMLLGA
ncbi:adipolin isoform X3 [Taeniopygia guttata]|uniref:Adipolin n=1 Tax=Taeniopygia guttata TaxID=59729 RepID=H0Z0W0_TAEGU|nr:adipolin isoform X2 [Taeniopygia guttata]